MCSPCGEHQTEGVREASRVIAALSGVRGQGCFLTIFTVRSTGSMANFIPSGTGGTESIAELANSVWFAAAEDDWRRAEVT